MKFAILVLTAIAGAVLAAPLAAAPPEKTIARGPEAIAFLGGTDGCTFTFTVVEASDDLSKPGAPTSSVRVLVEQFNSCTHTFLIAAAGTSSLLAPQFVVGNKASNATLIAKFSGLDQINNAPIEFDINLTWTAIGSPEKTHAVFHSRDRDFATISQSSKGLFADAIVTGSLKVGGINTPTGNLPGETSKFSDSTNRDIVRFVR